jgi:hypothetical protein
LIPDTLSCLAHINNKKFWEKLITYFPSIWYGHVENDATNNSSLQWECFYQVVTWQKWGYTLPSLWPGTTEEMHVQTHSLIGGFYEVRHSDGLRWHDIHTKFHKYWFRHSKDNGGIHRHTYA